MVYNISYGVAAAALLSILLVVLKTIYVTQSEKTKQFARLVWLLLCADVLDVFTAVLISFHENVPLEINIFFNTLFFCVIAFMEYQYAMYVKSYIPVAKIQKSVDLFCWLVATAFLILLIVNLFNGCLFYFDETGMYQRGSVYLLIYVTPIVYVFLSAISIIVYRRFFEIKQIWLILFFAILTITGSVAQSFIFKDTLLIIFFGSLGLCFGMFALETPDYSRLLLALEQLTQKNLEIEQAKAEVEIANQAKGEFLSGMSHEIRTPLNAILGYNELILKETKESQTVEYSLNVQTAGRTLYSMVNDILDVTDMENGEFELNPAPYSTGNLIENVLAYARYNTDKKGIAFQPEIGEAIPKELIGDSVRIAQILNNLISNATKYTTEGFVRLHIDWIPKTEKKGSLFVEVRDSGIGMSPDAITHIFAGNVRTEGEEASEIQGLGLGLSIVKQLLEQMGSELMIESEQGKGSCFSFSVEQDVENAMQLGSADLGYTHMSEPGDINYVAPGASVLVVDDNRMNLALFLGFMRKTQVHIDTASNGLEAIQKIKKKSYHIVFLDHMMPVLNGIETIKKIREEHLGEDAKYIALTANAIVGAREGFLQYGFDDFLAKPMSQQQLIDMVRKYLPAELVSNENISDEEEWTVTDTGNLMERASFLDTETAMAYCAGSESFYIQMLQAFYEDNKMEALVRNFAKKDWVEYETAVHTLKSTALVIGATQLSERAKMVERLTKERRYKDVEKEHSTLVEKYKKLLDALTAFPELQSTTSSEEERNEIISLMEEEATERILVVDDDAVNLRIAERMLGEYFTVDCVKSGQECLDYLNDCIPNLILLDLHMPRMSGFEVLEHLKGNENWKEIPVIFLTADADRETEVKCFESGALDFITKPFATEIVLKRVNRLLELKRLQNQLQREVTKQTTKAEERKKKLEKMSHDILTGLPLRNAGEKRIETAMLDYDGCLAFLDVDNLKKINDTIGHEAGDKVLKLMGDTLLNYAEDAIACRLGGDEFLLFMKNVSKDMVRTRIERIMDDFLTKKDQDVTIRQASLSVGLCMSSKGDEYVEVYNHADKALYHVKQNGKAGYFFYQQEDIALAHKADVDLEKLVNSLKTSGGYSGAMDVEYREFAKLFEYVGNLQERYNHEFHLVMITLEPTREENLYVENLEEAMTCMDHAIRETIRNVDICTRYSNVQFLVILLEAGDENVPKVLNRIFDKYTSRYTGDELQPVYSTAILDGKK